MRGYFVDGPEGSAIVFSPSRVEPVIAGLAGEYGDTDDYTATLVDVHFSFVTRED